MDTLQMLGLMVVAIVAAAAANVYLARQKRPQKWVQWGIVTFGGIGATETSSADAPAPASPNSRIWPPSSGPPPGRCPPLPSCRRRRRQLTQR